MKVQITKEWFASRVTGEEGKNIEVRPATEELMARRSAAAGSPSYFPGMDCQCSARSESECGCLGADWTPTQLRNLRRENAELRAIIYEVSTGGYTPMAAYEWLKSHPENAEPTHPAENR